MNRPYLLPALEYQWTGAVDDLASLIVTGWDTPDEVAAVRYRWGLTPEEVQAALMDAHEEIAHGWGRAQAA